jgi:hypothetical protein
VALAENKLERGTGPLQQEIRIAQAQQAKSALAYDPTSTVMAKSPTRSACERVATAANAGVRNYP